MTENFENTICNFPTSELPQRYGVVRSVVYQRMDALYIKRTRLGNKSYVLPEDLLLLDELHAHLSAGGKTEEFVSACIEAGSIEMPVAPLATNESALVQSSNETEIVQAEVDNCSGTLEVEIESNYSREDLIGEMVEERAQLVGAEDAAKLDKRSQQRAFAIAAAEETLTVAYRATENFTIPGMKEKLERHRRACDQAMDRGTVNIDDFLAKALAPLKIGTSGSPDLANSNKDRLAS